MRQTFIKIVQGHTLEFNRLLYPVRYNVLSQDILQAGTVILVEKGEQGAWCIKSLDKLPTWASEITDGLAEVIIENEKSYN